MRFKTIIQMSTVDDLFCNKPSVKKNLSPKKGGSRRNVHGVPLTTSKTMLKKLPVATWLLVVPVFLTLLSITLLFSFKEIRTAQPSGRCN